MKEITHGVPYNNYFSYMLYNSEGLNNLEKYQNLLGLILI